MYAELPSGFEFTRVYNVKDTNICFGLVRSQSYPDGLFHVNFSTGFSNGMFNLVAPKNEIETSELSSRLGMDESVRKLLLEICPRSIKGIVIENPKERIACILQKPIGGITGSDGMIRSIEHIYVMPEELQDDNCNIQIKPFVYQSDFLTYPAEVVNICVEFLSNVLYQLKQINDKKLENLVESYNLITQYVESIGGEIEKINNNLFEQFKETKVDDLVYNDYKLIKLQSFLSSIASRLKIALKDFTEN